MSTYRASVQDVKGRQLVRIRAMSVCEWMKSL